MTKIFVWSPCGCKFCPPFCSCRFQPCRFISLCTMLFKKIYWSILLVQKRVHAYVQLVKFLQTKHVCVTCTGIKNHSITNTQKPSLNLSRNYFFILSSSAHPKITTILLSHGMDEFLPEFWTLSEWNNEVSNFFFGFAFFFHLTCLWASSVLFYVVAIICSFPLFHILLCEFVIIYLAFNCL